MQIHWTSGLSWTAWESLPFENHWKSPCTVPTTIMMAVHPGFLKNIKHQTPNMSPCRHGTCDSCSGSADWVGSSSFAEHTETSGCEKYSLKSPEINANWVVLEGRERWPCNHFPVKFCSYNFWHDLVSTNTSHSWQIPLLQAFFTITKWWRLFGQCFLHWLGLCQALLGMLHHRCWGNPRFPQSDKGWLNSATCNDISRQTKPLGSSLSRHCLQEMYRKCPILIHAMK